MNYSDRQVEELLFSGEESEALADYFGAEDYAELRDLAEQIKQRDADGSALFAEGVRKRIYIVPGIMGSRLWGRRFGPDDWIWLDLVGIALGDVKKLKFGAEPRPVYASGVILKAYAKMKLRLWLAGYDADYLPYDWRHSVPNLGEQLLAKIKADGESDVTLVCHSMGGLVARRIAELDPDGKAVSQVITVGTPNHGSYSPVEVCALVHETLLMLAAIDQEHDAEQIAKEYIRHFPGLIEMLPAPAKRPGEDYFKTSGWASSAIRPLKAILKKAQSAKKALPGPDKRFVQIVGMNEMTIQSAKIQDSDFVFTRSGDGDGTVPRDLAEMGDVTRYYVDGQHGDLLNHGDVIAGVIDIVETGETDVLRTSARVAGLAAESAVRRDVISTQDLNTAIQNRIPASVDQIDESALLGATVSGGYAKKAVDDQTGAGIAVRSLGGPGARTGGPDEHDGAGDTVSYGKRLNGYPISILSKANRVWTGNKKKRERAERLAKEGRSIEAESEDRQMLIAKRMMHKVQQIADVESFAQMSPMMNETIKKAQFDEEGAAKALINERVMGEFEEFVSVLFLKRAPIAARAIGRIVERNSSYGFGTGFLIASGVMITNRHVLVDADKARESCIEFDYEINVRNREMPPRRFDLLPNVLFYANETLDFAIVAVSPRDQHDEQDLSKYGYLPLNGTLGKIRAERPVNIVQHPQGERKQAVFRNSKLHALPEAGPGEVATTGIEQDLVLQYSGDTKPGSSGSAVFNDMWEVVALHHASVPIQNAKGEFKLKDGRFMNPNIIQNGDDVEWVANQGIRVSKIVGDLRQLALSRDIGPRAAQLVNDVLDAGTDAEKAGSYAHLIGTGGCVVPIEAVEPKHSGEVVEPKRSQPQTLMDTGGPQVRDGTLSMTIPITVSLSFGRGSGVGPDQGDTSAVVDMTGLSQERRYTVADLSDREGFDRNFLPEPVALPGLLNTSPYSSAELLDGSGTELKYDHYSVVMCKQRRLAFFSAGNFDPSAPFHPARDKQPWSIDPRIRNDEQADNHFYRHNDLDRGHLFRRTDGSWGSTMSSALRADHDTYFWTNIAPQHEIYNQSKKKKEWLLWGPTGKPHNQVHRQQPNFDNQRIGV